MQTVTRSPFTSVKTEGGLLPADLLQRIADGDNLPGLRPVDYHLYEGERVNEAVNRVWNRCVGAWKGFKEQSEKIATTDSGTSLTRERWLLVLFQELGYGRLPALRSGLTAGDTSFPISHLWQATPIHLVTFRQGLDQRSEVSTAVKRSPHSLMQEFLNRSPEHQWGIIANGLTLRILRDNASLRRAAFVEFDLASIMQYELYAEFALLWMVCHQSRFEPFAETTKATAVKVARPAKVDDADEVDAEQEVEVEQATTTCWLEVWSKTAAERGTRAMDALRDGVKEAVEALGSGFLAHRENEALRTKLREGALRADSYYHQLRRMVYRLIFLAVAEDRDLLLLPETSADIKQLYSEHYSLRRLRTMSAVLRGGPHPDLHRQLRLLFVLVREGYPGLGLPGLGSFLFSDRSTPDLDNLELANQHLLAALRALSFTVEGRVRRAVDFRNLDSEELGSIYQSLLELHPEVNLGAATFVLNQGAGSERKTTGSHYTPTSLVESLLDTALEPVVADRLAKAEEQWRKGSGRTPEKLRQLQDDAILAIKVLDGATGSGHMLIGAGRRLARHLARIRTGEDEPSPEALRSAMRDVVRHCLYGVDLNDMAVELCKVALWMESMEPGKPLSFLDAHIQCGNSLIGVTPGLDIKEIPDDAFQPVTGDDKATATGLRRRNKKEREGKQFSLLYDSGAGETPEELERWRAAQMAKLEQAAEEAVTQVREKEIAYDVYLGSDQYETAKLQLDLWTATFFWPIPAGDPDHMLAPTQNALEHVRAGQRLDATLEKRVHEIADRHQFFHWALQYPDVFQRAEGGFDVILMNPPWERIRPEADKFFAVSIPEIVAMKQTERNKRIEMLSKSSPHLYEAWNDLRRQTLLLTSFLKSSGKFPLSTTKNVNSYAVFQELALILLSGTGRSGLIVQSGIATDDINRSLFEFLISEQRLVSLFDFENRLGLFPGVHRMMRFCLLTSAGASWPKTPLFVAYATAIEDIILTEKQYSLSKDDILTLSPNTGLLPMFRHLRDAKLVLEIYRTSGVFIDGGNDAGNPWSVSITRMFSIYYDSESLADAANLDFAPTENTSDSEFYVRLYEAKLFHQYDHRFASYTGKVLQAKSDLRTTGSRMPHQTSLPRYWMPASELQSRVESRNWRKPYFYCFRDVTNASNERTCIASIIPRSAPDDTIRVIMSELQDETRTNALLANLNSFVLDYAARCTVASTHLSEYVAKQLPILSPTSYSTADINFISSRVLELTYTAWDLQPFACDCGYDGPPFRWDEDRRFLLRCELDAAYFHLYGIERDDVDYIMETFPIVKRKDIAKHGEYRTKRVILEMYDDMAVAMQGGAPYVTRLEPPPADVRVAHDGKELTK